MTVFSDGSVPSLKPQKRDKHAAPKSWDSRWVHAKAAPPEATKVDRHGNHIPPKGGDIPTVSRPKRPRPVNW